MSGGLAFVLVLLGFAALYGLLFGIVAWSNARVGGALDGFRSAEALVEVPLDERQAEALCMRALSEVNQTRTWRPFKRRKLRVLSHVEDEGVASQVLELQLDPIGADRTRIRVGVPLTAIGGSIELGARSRVTVKRKRLLDRFVTWLAEHGDGRVVEAG